jgi:hypothetical protein
MDAKDRVQKPLTGASPPGKSVTPGAAAARPSRPPPPEARHKPLRPRESYKDFDVTKFLPKV